MGVTVTGFNHFHEIGDALPGLAHEIVYGAGLQVLHDAQANIRRNKQIKTGHMLGSGHIEPIDAYSLYVIFSADYSGYQELGTRYMAGRPFLVPAVESNRKPFEQAFDAIGRARGGFGTVGSEGRLS